MVTSNVKNISINLLAKSQRDYNTCRQHKRRICHAHYITGCFMDISYLILFDQFQAVYGLPVHLEYVMSF